MNRHYAKTKLFNPSTRRLAAMADFGQSLWELPPYVIARFGGELSKVMLEAAQDYIYLRCLEQQRQTFKGAAFAQSKHS